MRQEIRVPKFSPTADEATLVRWLKKEKDAVKKGETIFEIAALKLNMEVESPCDGTLAQILVPEGGQVKVDDVVAYIETAEKTGETIVEKRSGGPAVECDIAIIGGGPGGYVGAIRAAQLGARVVLIEKGELGGTCLNRGCIPTKTLAKSAKVVETLKKAQDFGIEINNMRFDYKKVMKRKDSVVARLRMGIEQLLSARKVRIVRGKATILSPREVAVSGNGEVERIKAEKGIVIATGSRPATLPIPGIESSGVINSDEILNMEELPESMTIIGGGVIGMEYAFILNSFGVRVTVVELMPRILPVVDDELSAVLEETAKERGINIYTSARVLKIQEAANGGLIVTGERDGQTHMIYSKNVFISIGRALNTEDLGLEELGIEKDRAAIKVDDRMRTNVPGIYAVGDVNGKLMLAHVASYEAIKAVENMMGIDSKVVYDHVPNVIFTQPEIGSIGLTQKAAEEMGYRIKVGKFNYAASGKAVSAGETLGFVKLIINEADNKILGAHIIGEGAPELIHEVVAAMAAGLDARALANNVHAHPTLSECVMEAAHAAIGQPIHSL